MGRAADLREQARVLLDGGSGLLRRFAERLEQQADLLRLVERARQLDTPQLGQDVAHVALLLLDEGAQHGGGCRLLLHVHGRALVRHLALEKQSRRSEQNRRATNAR